MDADRFAEYMAAKEQARFWNSKTKALMGRTATQWFQLLLFYVIFYLVLAAIFSFFMYVFYQTLDTERMPKYTPGSGTSLLRNPAMGFRPLPPKENIKSTIIYFKHGDYNSTLHWTNALDEFIRPYEVDNRTLSGQQLKNCSDGEPTMENEVCDFTTNYLGPCSKASKWGYDKQAPCVLLKFNRMIDWVPDVYEHKDEFPEDMPDSLKKHVEKVYPKGVLPKMIWVSCQGVYPSDEEYLGKDIIYSPHPGFSANYYPFRNTPGYLPPIVAVQFSHPQSNKLISIECRAWAKNIEHDKKKRFGLVTFELLMD